MVNFEGVATDSVISIINCYYSFNTCPTTANSLSVFSEFSALQELAEGSIVGHFLMMLVKAEQHARFSLANSCFDQVAKIDFVKNKWITLEAWFELIKKEIPNLY